MDTSEVCWQAVVGRNKQADGSFVYAVRTTGVYCRPSCASRQPNRGNVAFFAGAAEAEHAGFRPCKRCQPHVAASLNRHIEAIAQACTIIEQAEATPKLDALAEAVNLSPYHFHRLFKQTIGVTPRQYALNKQMHRVQERLQQDGTVTEAIFNAGFASSSSFYERTEALGMAPSTYRKGAQGEHIHYAIASSSLGWVLVAATERGICTIDFADEPAPLHERLHARFSQAALTGDPAFADWVAQVVAFVEVPQRGLDLPLDIQGTAFQQRVWSALRAIPVGTTASYTEIAQQIGSPTAARAVATACAANTLAVAVPCHRVVRGDGGLSGYRWGIERKRALLEQEVLQ